jgi:voltage-gated potassium channel Kch
VNRVTALVLRRMRAPLLALIGTYSVAVLGFVLIPGLDEQGVPWDMDFLHAFYVVTYTATTIGFGELPYLFTPAQRIWMTITVYLTVVTWFYAIGNIATLVQDPAFRLALRENRFRRAVTRLREPFYLVCGYGDTGSLLVRSLAERGLRAVVIDLDEDRISALKVDPLSVYVPGLAADAAVPAHLIEGGLQHPHCAGVLALTDRDPANLLIAITTKLLNPRLPVICRAETADTAANMASFGTDYVVNPFEAFAERLAMALYSPEMHVLFEWLTGVPRSQLEPVIYPPRGTWVLCGYGRFGKALRRRLEGEGVTTVVVELDPEGTRCSGCVPGRGTEAGTLYQAGVDAAVGIVAGTDDDANNLSILMTARAINPRLFLVARQNRRANDAIFQASRADLVMQRSQIIGHEILAVITTPLLPRFLTLARGQAREWAESLVDRLASEVGAIVPDLWTVTLRPETAPAVAVALQAGTDIRLAHLLADPHERGRRLPCIPLLLVRGGEERLLPDPELAVAPDDALLFCGAWEVASRMQWVYRNDNALLYVLTGEDAAAGHLWRWLGDRRRRPTPSLGGRGAPVPGPAPDPDPRPGSGPGRG